MKLIFDTDCGGAKDTFDIDAVVVIETFVFDRDKSVCQIFGNHIHADRNPVGIRRYQFGRLVAFDVVYEGRKTGRGNVYVANIGSCCENSLKNADAGAGSKYGG